MGARFKTEGITLKKGDLIMALTSNQHVLDWVKEMEELMTPDKTIWIDGSEGQLRALREQAFATGELTELNQEELPGMGTVKKSHGRNIRLSFILKPN